MSNVKGGQLVADLQGGRANKQVFEGNVDTARCLFTFDATGELGDFDGHRMNGNVAAEFLSKSPPAFAVGVALRSVNSMRQFNDGDDGQCDVDFPKRDSQTLENLGEALATALTGNEHGGVEHYSHVEMWRGLRLLIIASK